MGERVVGKEKYERKHREEKDEMKNEKDKDCCCCLPNKRGIILNAHSQRDVLSFVFRNAPFRHVEY